MYIYWIIGFLIIQVIQFLGTWRLYQKAGRKSWEAAIPIYNLMVMLKINRRPLYWTVLFFIPVICVVMYGVLWVDFIRCFGKRSTKDTCLVLLTLGLYIYCLNYTKNIQYLGPEERKETMISALLFAIVIRLFDTHLSHTTLYHTDTFNGTYPTGRGLYVCQ